MHPLHVKVVLEEAASEVIEQRLVARRIGETQIVGRIDNANIEVVGPDAIDECLGEVPIVGTPQPVHQRLARIVQRRDVYYLTAENAGRNRGGGLVATGS